MPDAPVYLILGASGGIGSAGRAGGEGHGHEAIAAAMAGVGGLMQAVAATYACRGIGVNAVAVGLGETPRTAPILAGEAGRRQPEAIAWLLGGTRSGWVAGQVIGVDGGLSTLRPR